MNKKRKKKLVTSSILLVLLVGFLGLTIGFSGISNVKGDGMSGNNGGSSGNIGGDGSCTKNCISSLRWGVRIALVDKAGNLVGHSADFWPAGASIWNEPKRKNVSVKTVDASYGKNIKQSASASVSTGVYWNSGNVYEFDLQGLSIAIKDSQSTNKLMNKIKSLDKDSDELKQVTEKLFSYLGYSKSLNEAAAEELFIQFEPLIATHRHGTSVSQSYYFIGTVTEFALADPGIAKDGGAYATVMTREHGLEVYIKSNMEKPSNFQATAANTVENLTNLSIGNDVAHIWTRDLLSANDCEFILEEVIHKNPGKYPVGQQAYHDAITAIRSGDTKYTFEDASGKKYNIDKAYNDARENFWLFQTNYEKREKMGKKAQCVSQTVSCEHAVDKVLNSNWDPDVKTGTPEYDAAILEVIAGTYAYYSAPPNAVKEDYYLIDRAYPTSEKPQLDKAVYGNGLASCNQQGTKNCEEMVDYINKNFYGDPTYNDKIAEVRNGTFSYNEETIKADGTKETKTYRIDRAYPELNMLLPANYGNGQAKCDVKPVNPPCGKDAIIKIDPCESGYNYYKDSSLEDDWLKCETAYLKGGTKHTSDNTGHIAVETTNGGIVGNSEYCKLFCYEEVETNFPAKVTEVKAGQTFGWGQSGYGSSNKFGTVSVHKHCSNKKRTDAEGLSGDGYLYKKWENDYKANEKNLIDGYIQKGAAEDARAKLDEQHLYGATRTCCQTETYSCKVGNRWTTCTRCKIWGYVGWAYSGQSHNNQDNSFEGSSNWSGASTQPASGRGSSACVLSYSEAENTARNQAYNQLTNQINSGASKSSSAKTKEPKLLEKIRQCTNNIKYVYKTVVTFSFDEPTNHEYGPNDRMFSNHDELEVKPLIGTEGYNENNVNKSSCKTKRVPTYSCSGDRLSAKCVVASIENVLDCTQVTWDIKGEWEYDYPAGEFEWYSLKTNNKLMNGTNKTGEGDEFFYSLGFGLPTAFTLTSGEYDMAVIVTNLGDHGEITDAPGADYNVANGHFGPVAESINGGKGFEYECTYEVDNDIFGYDCVYENGRLTSNSPKYCDNSKDDDSNGELVGIDVAYRLVSLLNTGDDINKAFPGQDGSGRTIGSNWSEVLPDIPDILRADIYQQDRNGQPNLAMYEIFLDVKKIQEIRQDSKNFAGSGDPYTSFENIKCAGDNQKYCASDFISELASTGPDATRLYGTCITDIDTQTRANNVLANGCNGTYTFPTINWVR